MDNTLKVGSRVKIKPEYKEYIWYSEKIYTITDIGNTFHEGNIAELNENLNNLESNKIRLSLLYDIKENRKEKLLTIINK